MAISYGPRWNIIESYNATVTASNPILKISISSGGGDIGARGHYFSGRIGVSRIYNRALSANEVRQNFNAQRRLYGI